MAETTSLLNLRTGNCTEGSNPSASADSFRQKATKDRQTVQIEKLERFFVCLCQTKKTENRQIKPVFISQFVPPSQKSHYAVQIVQHWQFG